jgi:CxxC motif-containing protein (DUF1111 family)
MRNSDCTNKKYAVSRNTNQYRVIAIAIFASFDASFVLAVSPATVEQGRQLFERNWPTENPASGSDGLGPLFNARSCVACHHQGGVGGGGDSRFNAKTVALDRFRATGQFDRARMKISDLAGIFARFHPGFSSGPAGLTSSFSLAHHGGSAEYARRRVAMLEGLPASFSDSGGPTNAAEVRRANSSPILASQQARSGAFTIQARLYQRNTPSLFGAGLIDQISIRQIKELALRQRGHPEVSGRLLGRFGWRGNSANLLDFCDQACANELGLQTKRALQASDPTVHGYQHRSVDISDSMIRSMAAFIAALPAPTRQLPTDLDERTAVHRGEKIFASIGCALCHVPDVGPAKGLYSDILLHDMGAESYDPNMAPSVVGSSARVVGSAARVVGSATRPMETSTASGRRMDRDEFKQIAAKAKASTAANELVKSAKNRLPTSRLGASQGSPRYPQEPGLAPARRSNYPNRTKKKRESAIPLRPSTYYGGSSRLRVMDMIRTDSGEYVQPRLEAHREWRTPPLWGVRDSAPYMHDGRAETLLEAIVIHEGEAQRTRDRFLNLPLADRHAVIVFLETLVAPPNVPQPRL